MHLQTILEKLACIKQQVELLEAKLGTADEFLHSEVARDAFYESVEAQTETTESLVSVQCVALIAEVVAYEQLFPSNPQGED